MQPRQGNSPQQGAFQDLEATSLFCPRCQRAQPVRRRLLLVLPSGDKYAYFCAVCGEEVGSKLDKGQDDGLLWRPGR